MDSITELMQLCRLCLVNDEVNIPIFEEQGEVRQIFLKISACLPVKVSKEDNLPKNICDGCSCKLEMLHQFRSTSLTSEKKLVKWLDQIAADKHSDKRESATANSLPTQHSNTSSNPVVLKQEVIEADSQSTGDDLVPDDLHVSNDAQDYLIQQQQLPYQSVEFQFQQEDGFETVAAEDEASNVEIESEPKQRKRRAAAVKALATMESEDEDDPDLINPKIAKTEEQSDDSGEDPEPTTFVGIPTADDEQPGPSGVGKSGTEAPYLGEMGIRKVNISLNDKRDLRKYRTMFEKYRKTHHLKNGVVILNDLSKLDLKLFQPSKKMAQYLTRKPVNLRADSLTPSPKKESTARGLQKKKAEETLNIFGKGYQKQQFPCKLCKETFENELQLKRHKMVHFMKKNQVGPKQAHVCYLCRKSFVERQTLLSHMRQHTEQQHHQCKDCSKVFKSARSLQLHRIECMKQSKPDLAPRITVPNVQSSFRYRCNICLKKFEDVFEMREHKESHYEKEEEISEISNIYNTVRSPSPTEAENDAMSISNENESLLSRPISANVVENETINTESQSTDMPNIEGNSEVESEAIDTLQTKNKDLSSSSANVNLVVESKSVVTETQVTASDTVKTDYNLNSRESLRCEICDDIFENNETFLEHTQFHQDISQLIPDTTSTRPTSIDFSDQSDSLSADAQIDSDDDQLVVNDCVEDLRPKIFVKNIQDLMPENKNQEIPKKVQNLHCEDCNKIFKKTRLFRKHKRLSAERYKCNQCTFFTCSFKKLRDHYESEHNILHICLKCKIPCDIAEHQTKKPKSKSCSV